MHDKVSISSLVRFSRCPVLYYLEGNKEVVPSYWYEVCKQLAYHLEDGLDPDLIWAEIVTVRPEIPPGFRDFLDECIRGCSQTPWKKYRETDVSVSSDRFGMYGRVDKLFDDPPYFGIVRASIAPIAGIFPSDRLRASCYALCLGEMMQAPVETGQVEYIPSGVTRTFSMQSRDRRAVLSALRGVAAMRDGTIPKKSVNARCDRCPAGVRCPHGPRTLSDLL